MAFSMMAGSVLAAARERTPPMLRMLRYAMLAALAMFVIVTSAKAMRAPLQVDGFPEALLVKAEIMPVTFAVHMVSGGLALLLAPSAWLARHLLRPWHRTIGRLAAIDIVVAGVTAYPVASVAPVTPVSAAGFAAQATAWLALLAAGIVAIRRGDADRHRACMLLMLSVTSGAIFFRIWLALWAIFAHGRHFALFYAANAWIAWVLPLGLTTWLLKQAGPSPVDAR